MSKTLIGKKINNHIYDLCTIEQNVLSGGEPVYFDNSEDSLEIIRHSCAHLMAQAIKAIYPEAQFFVGPVVEEGFYYDFRVAHKIGEEDLPAIESKMREIAQKAYPIEKYTTTRLLAQEKFANDELKLAVMSKIEGDNFSFYTQGDFEDLCRGPHLPNTKFLEHFKLTKIAGAYLGGDENAQMLTRIYGIAFSTKEALKEYLFQIQEAKKRDHRKIGQEMGLFSFDEEIGAGLPLWLPKGARLRRNIENLLTKALIEREYEPVRGPEILKSDVWKKSGHYENYKENMYFTTIDDQEYGIKPMNCVGHIKVYQSSPRSYRELPLRFYEYGVVHRHEKSGVLHGLLRVREFTQDDAHIFCTPAQIKDEVHNIIAFTCLTEGGTTAERAAFAMGGVMADLYKVSPEDAKNIVRRFMWHMNEESGNIGWGIPEAFAETLAQVPPLADTFRRVLLHYIYDAPEEKSTGFCDHAPLRISCYHAIARLLEARPEFVAEAMPLLRLSAQNETDEACRDAARALVRKYMLTAL